MSDVIGNVIPADITDVSRDVIRQYTSRQDIPVHYSSKVPPWPGHLAVHVLGEAGHVPQEPGQGGWQVAG